MSRFHKTFFDDLFHLRDSMVRRNLTFISSADIAEEEEEEDELIQCHCQSDVFFYLNRCRSDCCKYDR